MFGAPVEAALSGLADSRASLCALSSVSLAGPEAYALAEAIAEHERLAVALKVRCARLAHESGEGARHGWADAGSMLSGLSGTARGQGQAAVKTAQALEASPTARAAFENGELSVPQAEQVAKLAGQDEAAVKDLVELARDHNTTLGALRDQAARAQQASRSAEDDAQRDARIHARRSLRFNLTDEGVEFRGFLPTKDGARVLTAIRNRKDNLFKSAPEGEYQSDEQYNSDALVSLILGAQRLAGDGTHVVSIHISADALRSGVVGHNDLCEIDGFGPISVAHARALLGDAVFHFVIDDGIDVYRITSDTRYVPSAVERALYDRDRHCVVPGCDMALGLEKHHWDDDFEITHKTELGRLCLVCRRHHALLSNHTMRLIGGPGHWRFVEETRYGYRQNPPAAKRTANAAATSSPPRRTATARVVDPEPPPRVHRG